VLGGFRILCGEVDLDLGRAAIIGEAWVPAVEAAGQVVVEDSGAGLEEKLGSGRGATGSPGFAAAEPDRMFSRVWRASGWC